LKLLKTWKKSKFSDFFQPAKQRKALFFALLEKSYQHPIDIASIYFLTGVCPFFAAGMEVYGERAEHKRRRLFFRIKNAYTSMPMNYKFIGTGGNVW